MRFPFALILCAFICGCSSQPTDVGAETQPDRHGEIKSSTPALRSAKIKADAPVPGKDHQRNTGGSDGQGLCVYASAVTAMRWLELRQQAEALWEHAKRHPGGSYPTKFGKDMRNVIPGVKFAQYEGDDYSVLVRLSKQGLAVPVTMGTGSLYGYRTIAHMVTGIHFDDRWACIVDNNDPGQYYWMPKDEFMRRWTKPAGQGWAIAFEPRHWVIPGISKLSPSSIASMAIVVCAVMRRRFTSSDVERSAQLMEVAS